MIDIDKMTKNVIDRVFGETNLYKIDRWEYPSKLCKHNQATVCKECAEELQIRRS